MGRTEKTAPEPINIIGNLFEGKFNESNMDDLMDGLVVSSSLPATM